MKIITFLLILSTITFCLTSCSEEKVVDNKAEAREQRRLAQEAELERKKAELAAIEAEETARKQAQARAEQAKRLAEEQELQRKLEEQRLAAEKEARRIAALELQHSKQREACLEYVGTKYDELKLLTGKTLKSVKVTNANHEYVSMMHSGGVANVKYSDLPKEIGKACKYDAGLESWMLEKEMMKAKLRAEAKAIAEIGSDPKTASRNTSRNNPKAARSASAEKDVPKEPVVPKGYIKVRIVRVKGGNKTIEITGIANVDSTLYLNDYTWSRYYTHTVVAGERFKKIWSSVGSKYDVKLQANSGGKVLDREAHNKKSGLGGVDGL